MRRVLAAALLLLPALAQARAWKGIAPGTTPAAEVTKRFGEPTRRLKHGKKQVLAYTGDEAIAGAKQAEFILDEEGKVEQIAVFPDGVVEREAIEQTYGPDCAQKPEKACFTRKVSEDDFKTYYWYASLGLVVFFNSDAKTVQSFLYVKPAPHAAPTGPQAPGAPAGPRAPAATANP